MKDVPIFLLHVIRHHGGALNSVHDEKARAKFGGNSRRECTWSVEATATRIPDTSRFRFQQRRR